jgi:hypothetical protein
MRNRFLAAMLTLTVSVGSPLAAQSDIPADVAAGIRQLENGDPEAAVLTLDSAVHRLSGEKGREKDLALAHLYLGISHIALSQWETAKADMREAWRHNKELKLDPKKFSSEVLQLFEEAKIVERPSQPAPSPQPTPSAAAKSKKGSKLPLVIIGIAGAGGAAAALAAGSKGTSPPPTTTTPPAPPGTVSTILTLNGQNGGTFSCREVLVFRLYASNTTPNTVHLNRFNLTFTSNATSCTSHAAPVDGSAIDPHDLAAGATNLQLRQIDLSGDLCLPPNGSSGGCSWQANVVLETAIGNFATSLQFTTTR